MRWPHSGGNFYMNKTITTNDLESAGWRPVLFSNQCQPCPCGCGKPWCVRCGEHASECGCPGPTQDGVEYLERGGITYGREIGCFEASNAVRNTIATRHSVTLKHGNTKELPVPQRKKRDSLRSIAGEGKKKSIYTCTHTHTHTHARPCIDTMGKIALRALPTLPDPNQKENDTPVTSGTADPVDLPEMLTLHARLIWTPELAVGVTLRQPTRTVVMAFAQGHMNGASLGMATRSGLVVLGRAGCLSGCLINDPGAADSWHWVPWHAIEAAVKTKWSITFPGKGRTLREVLAEMFGNN